MVVALDHTEARVGLGVKPVAPKLPKELLAIVGDKKLSVFKTPLDLKDASLHGVLSGHRDDACA